MSYIYHQYERKNQKFPSVTNAMLKESNRLATLLNIGDKKENLEEFGLGKERTLKEYEEFAGLNFKDKMVYMTAETGEFENKELKNKLDLCQQVYIRYQQLKEHTYGKPHQITTISKKRILKHCRQQFFNNRI